MSRVHHTQVVAMPHITPSPITPRVNLYVDVYARVDTDVTTERYVGLWGCTPEGHYAIQQTFSPIKDLHAFIDPALYPDMANHPVYLADPHTIQWRLRVTRIILGLPRAHRNRLKPQAWTVDTIDTLEPNRTYMGLKCETEFFIPIKPSMNTNQGAWAYHPDTSAIMQDIHDALTDQIGHVMEPYPDQPMVTPLLDGTRLCSDILHLNVNPLVRSVPMNGQPWHSVCVVQKNNMQITTQRTIDAHKEWIIGPLIVIDGVCSLGISAYNSFHDVTGITIIGHHTEDRIMVVPYSEGMDHGSILDAIACTIAVTHTQHSMMQWKRRSTNDPTVRASIQRILDQAAQLQSDVHAWHGRPPGPYDGL